MRIASQNKVSLTEWVQPHVIGSASYNEVVNMVIKPKNKGTQDLIFITKSIIVIFCGENKIRNFPNTQF